MQKIRVHKVASHVENQGKTEDWSRVAIPVAGRDLGAVAGRDLGLASRDVSSALEYEKMF